MEQDAYPDTLPRHIHDDVMAALESESGQQAKEFADYLFRYTLADGNNALQLLHKEGMIKKVPTNQVIVTPDNRSNVRLDELNGILAKMAMGEEAVKELAELDAGAGLSGKQRRRDAAAGEVRAREQPEVARARCLAEGAECKLHRIAGRRRGGTIDLSPPFRGAAIIQLRTS